MEMEIEMEMIFLQKWKVTMEMNQKWNQNRNVKDLTRMELE